MRQKIQSMHVALDQAVRQEKLVANDLNSANQLLAQQRHYLQSLFDYQQEYQNKLHQTATIRQANLVREYKSFLANLEQMVMTQQQTISNTEHQITLLRDQWKLKNAKVKALEQVLSEYHQTLVRQEETREQVESDENTQRAQYQKEDVLD